MPVQTIEKLVDGHTVTITQFFAIRGIQLKARLWRLVLPVLGELVGGVDKGTDLSKLSLDSNVDINAVFPKALSKLSETVSEKTLLDLLLDLFASTRLDGRELNRSNFDEIFIGDYMLVYKIAWAVVDANNFFGKGGIGNILQKVQDQKSNNRPVPPKESKSSQKELVTN